MTVHQVTESQRLMAQAFGALAHAASQAPTMQISTRAVLTTTNVPTSVQGIQTFGYNTVGDGGDGLYARSSSPAQVDSADGAHWRLVTETPHVAQFGAVGNGSTNDLPAINAAIAFLPATGGEVYFSPKTYAIAGTLTIGNGTSSTISTKCGVVLKCRAGGGVSDTEYGTPNTIFRLLYTGASGAGTNVVVWQGPIHSVGMENCIVDCNLLARRGITLYHVYNSNFFNVEVINWGQTTSPNALAWYLTTQPSSFSGVTQGCMDNVFINVKAREPNLSTHDGTGFYLEDAGAGCSRNIFIGMTALIPGNAGSFGIYIVGADNNHFERVHVNWGDATHNGNALFLSKAGCTENLFCNTSFIGGVVEDTGGNAPGNNIILGYNTSDGEPAPPVSRSLKVMSISGQMYNGFAGSAVIWSGGNSNAVALVASGSYSPSGLSNNDGNAQMSSPMAFNIRKWDVSLGVAPGGVASRTFVIVKNGADQTGTITFGSGQSGNKTNIYSTPLTFAGGDVFYIRADVSGAPAASNATWAFLLEPAEVI